MPVLPSTYTSASTYQGHSVYAVRDHREIGVSSHLASFCVQVWVEQLCGRLLAHSVASYTAERQEQERQFQLCLRRMHNLTESLQVSTPPCRNLQELA